MTETPDLSEMARAAGAAESKSGSFHLSSSDDAIDVARALGAEFPDNFRGYSPAELSEQTRDGKLLLRIPRQSGDLTAVAVLPVPDVRDYDGFIRHRVTPGGMDAGWSVRTGDQWRDEKPATIRLILAAKKISQAKASQILGTCAANPWVLVKIPFGPEHMKGRLWNRNAPRLKYPPSAGPHPTWARVLCHIGQGLDEGVRSNAWCRSNGVATGAEYLKCWIASMFQFPSEPLPYLFLFSRQQDTGKSILAEALERVIVDGVVRAKAALKSQADFNAELLGKVLCVVEEGDLKGVKGAYEKIKEWTTSPTIQIHQKGLTPYQATNHSHWIHTSNDPDGCPIDAEDTRVTMIEVSPLDPREVIGKPEMLYQLEREAPAFLATLASLDLAPTNQRLRVPVIETEQKTAARKRNQTMLQIFRNEHTFPVDGATVKVTEFCKKFAETLDPAEKAEWPRKRVIREMLPKHPKGRRRSDSQHCFGNIAWSPGSGPVQPKLILRGEKLEPAF